MPSDVTRTLKANLEALRHRIEAARSGGSHAAAAVELLVVTKSAPTWLFPHLAAAGVTAVGENRVQSALARRGQAPGGWTWHGIGHLQRNKAREAVQTFDVFHGLDSLRLAERLDAVLAQAERVWPVYVQVNAAEDPAKGGFRPDEVPSVLGRLSALPHLRPVGFMTMARLGGSERDVRATFRTLRGVRDEAVRQAIGDTAPSGLSMGMTDDFELAVEEGATLVRVGRAVFADVPMEGPVTHQPNEEERA